MANDSVEGELSVCWRCGGPLPADATADDPTLCAQCLATAEPEKEEAPPAEGPDWLVGQVLEDFEVLERIGDTPSGHLYKAHQKSADRLVVLKLLPEELLENDHAVSHFYAEARAAAAVVHPNVVATLSFGCVCGRHFIAMEHAEGESLAALLEREERLPAGQALAIMRMMADALVATHAAGIVHCDIRPANILVTPAGEAKLTGFTLARPRGQRRPTPDTHAEAALYFPPEAARGTPLDERSDLHLLGATFYHAIAGRPPFEGASAEERALQYVRNEVPSLRQIVPTARVALCLLIHKLLSRKPGERYQTAAEVREAIERLEALVRTTPTEPVWAKPTGAEARAEKLLPEPTPPDRAMRAEARRKRQKLTLISSIAAFVLLSGLALALLQWGGERLRTAAAPPNAAPSTAAGVEPPTAEPAPPPPPAGPATPAPPPIVLRAADAMIHGKVRYEHGGGKDNIGYWMEDTAHVTWNLRLTDPGTYEIDIVLAAAPESDGNEYAVAIADQQLKGKVHETGSWTNFVRTRVGTVTVAKPGAHTVAVWPVARKPGTGLMNLQSVILRRMN